MLQRSLTATAFLALLMLPGLAGAVWLDDGAVHLIPPEPDAPADGIRVQPTADGRTTTLHFTAGVVGSDLEASGSHTYQGSGLEEPAIPRGGVVNVCGGTAGSLEVWGGGEMNVTGGTFNDVWGYSLAAYTNDPGDPAAVVNISGGQFNGVWSIGRDAVVSVYGSDFNFPYGDILAPAGTLTGVLGDGTPLAVDFGRDPTGTLTLLPGPGPDDSVCNPLAGSIEIDIDIWPWSDFDVIDPFSETIVPVALLGSADFDVMDVDVTTLGFGPQFAPPLDDFDSPWAPFLNYGDVNGDNQPDLRAHFVSNQTGIAVGDPTACITGATLQGQPFEGCAAIRTVVFCGLGAELLLVLPPLMWLYRRRRRPA